MSKHISKVALECHKDGWDEYKFYTNTNELYFTYWRNTESLDIDADPQISEYVKTFNEILSS